MRRAVRHLGIWVGAIGTVFAWPASADNRDVDYAPPANWVVPAPKPTDTPTPDAAAYRIAYSDNQVHFGPSGVELYQAYRVKILRPEGLPLGNLSVTWSPDAGEAKVHYVRIVRNKEAIDVLRQTKFQVLQRENALEQATLNGQLTAALQTPGLQIGDELEFAVTVRQKDPTLADHLFAFGQLPTAGGLGAFRLRMVWPTDSEVRWRASSDITGIAPKPIGNSQELVYELKDPKPAIVAEGAPSRFNTRRFIEVSDFERWKEVSQRIWPLFDAAAKIPPDSPIRKEIAQIAAADTDPVKRMQSALKLVQDQVRYVYIGINGGNLMPASADDTWKRRFGDCKAKTALLLGVLQELGIQAEAVLVNVGASDGLIERLPSPGLFNHVVVRATLGDKTYWLDGTRLGDRSLDGPNTYRWVLPLRAHGSDLENIPTTKPRVPSSITLIDVDATAGFTEKAALTVKQVFRGDGAQKIRWTLIGLSPDAAEQALRGYWRKSDPWIEADTVSWSYDEQRGTLLLTLAGKGKLDWTGDDKKGRGLAIFGAGFNPPDEYHRPKDQDQTAPWVTGYPLYRCWATAIRLPAGDTKWKWDYESDPMNQHLGGIHYWRVTDLRDGVMRTVMSKRDEVPEITAAEAEQVNEELPEFNNNQSQVYQIESGSQASSHEIYAVPPFQSDTDWTSPNAPCGPLSN